MKDFRVLVLEPPNQQLPVDTARPNGSLGPAYLVAALRRRGIEADYLDATVGWPDDSLDDTFYRRLPQENGTVRYGMSRDRLAEVFAAYDVIATSSIFTAQTRMHFEMAEIAGEVSRQRGRRILMVSGGVSARALRTHFLSRGFDVVALAEGEQAIVDIVEAFAQQTPDFSTVDGIAYVKDGIVVTNPARKAATRTMDELPPPALDALPLATYRDLRIPHAGVLPPGLMFAAMQTSRGCQDKCTFCHISLEKIETDLVGQIGFLREFSRERIGEDVDRAYALGVRRLYFEDDNLFFNKKRLRELAPFLRREGLEYANVNGANLRFLLKKDGSGGYAVDDEFIDLLADFGLRELVLPFESRNTGIIEKYASGKYDPDVMDSVAIVRALKRAGIRIAGNFMIGFRDEPWESVLRTRAFAGELRAAGLDAVGFMIPVPYPGSVDFETLMADTVLRADFDRDPLRYTDRMHWRARPLFPTLVPGERLEASVREFWMELNDTGYTQLKVGQNVVAQE
jgi:radical SAM superfamily enzyme YgiQ (UPF0313 family)